MNERGLFICGDVMSERKKSRSNKRHSRSFRQKCMPTAKIFAWIGVAAAVVAASIFAFDRGNDSEASLPLPRIKRDLTTHSESSQSDETFSDETLSTEAAAEPARLEIAATSQAQSINAGENHGPLFNESVDFASNSPESESIEVTQFRPSTTTTSTGRVQANRAAWLTGQIETID